MKDVKWDKKRLRQVSPNSTIRKLTLAEFEQYQAEGRAMAEEDYKDAPPEERALWANRYGNFFASLSDFTRQITRSLDPAFRKSFLEDMTTTGGQNFDISPIVGTQEA